MTPSSDNASNERDLQIGAPPSGHGNGTPQLARTSSYYVLTAVTGLLGMLKMLVYAKLLGSEALGFYALGVLVATYVQTISQLGLSRGLECHLPALYGAGKHRRAEQLRNRVAGALLLSSVCIIACFTAGSYLLPTLDSNARTVLFFAGLLSSATLLFGLPALDMRCRGRIVTLGLIGCARTLANLVLGIVAALQFGCIGVLGAEAVVAGSLFVVAAWRACRNFRFEFGPVRELKKLGHVGAPLTLRNLVNSFSQSLDRWCVTIALGVVAFGQYAFATIVVSAGMLTYTAVWSHVGPRAVQLYGRSGDLGIAFRSLRKNAMRLAVVAVTAWVPFKLTMDFAVAEYFPEYEQGGRLLTILYWGSACQLVCIFDWIPMAAKRTAGLFWLTLAAGCFTAVLYGLAITGHWPLAAFAWIFVLGRAITAAGQVGIAMRMTNAGLSSARLMGGSGCVEPSP